MNKLLVKKQLEHFFIEDLGESDVTSESAISTSAIGKAKIVAKGNGVMAGCDLLTWGYGMLDSTISVQVLVSDGEEFQRGDTIAILEG
ncbi:nicotinate-nucleotide diphosphorylase (carboxylating), partial [Desertibacillus haloalkaliphilus]|nr:nicotinate-nucleotide diphosphorylase (carboxylating) [Desertibacillus haloalkaliphilus]